MEEGQSAANLSVDTVGSGIIDLLCMVPVDDPLLATMSGLSRPLLPTA